MSEATFYDSVTPALASGDYQVIKVVHSGVAQYTIWAYELPGSR